MRIAVMGAGSIGGYFGGMLAQSGHDVTLIARGKHLETIRKDGLTIVNDDGRFSVNCDATEDLTSIGIVDLVLLTVKTYQNEMAIPPLRSLIDSKTSILCLQNGMDSYQSITRLLQIQDPLPGAAYIEASVQSPGIIRQSGTVVKIVFGELNGTLSSRGTEIQNVLSESQIDSQFTTNILKTLWTKFLFISTMAGITCLARETLAQLVPKQDWSDIITDCMKEIEAVGRGNNINLDNDVVKTTMDYIIESLDTMQASMHTDLMAGRPLELDALNGAVVRAGKLADIPTPINSLIYAMLKPYELGS